MRVASVLLGSVLALGACSVETAEDAVPTGSTAIVAEVITVSVALPAQRGTLLGPATGRVLDGAGLEVAQFEFASGWDMPADWQWGNETPPRSGAPTVLEVELPEPGFYTFELDDYAVSGGPCGTCEAGFEGGSLAVDVVEGIVVELTAGDSSWVS